MNYVDTYLEETKEIVAKIDREQINKMIDIYRDVRTQGGRLFVLGVGGSAANSSHAVNDFRKIAGIETYAPTDNVSELTAWTNDNSFDVVFKNWLTTSRLNSKDCLLVFSVGGGSKNASQNLVLAMQYAKEVNARVTSVVSRNGGAAKELSDACVLVPVVSEERITPHAEGWQAVIWHLVVNAL